MSIQSIMKSFIVIDFFFMLLFESLGVLGGLGSIYLVICWQRRMFCESLQNMLSMHTQCLGVGSCQEQ